MSSVLAGYRSLVIKLGNTFALDEQEKQAIVDLPIHIRELAPGQDIVREGDRPTQSCLLLEGFALRYRVVGNGQRQILSFHLPGDIPDLQSLYLSVLDHSLSVLSRSTIGLISHQSIRNLIHEHPRVGDALWRDTLIDAAILREWMVGIGRRDARARIAHLFCELVTRMEAIGRAENKSVRLPLTQGTIADALGLSPVHVNRVTQELRREGLITWEGRVLTIDNWEGLAAVAEFDPLYLHAHRAENGVLG